MKLKEIEIPLLGAISMIGGNKIEGDDNVLVAGDLHITIDDIHAYAGKKITNLIDHKINDIDTYVNNKVVEGIIPSKNLGGQNVPFKSLKIIESLGRVGIPLTASLEAVTETANQLVNNYNLGKKISTRFIRSIITESLYGLDEDKYSRSMIEKWGDSYIRRYGSETQIRMIGYDGIEVPISYELLSKVIIPSAISGISEKWNKVITETAWPSVSLKKKMATEILDIISSLNLYRIHVNSLTLLVKEIITQPPHPWIASKEREFSYINYDYERYKSNLAKAKYYRSINKFSKCKYVLKEFVHHACSAFLCYYSVYMGCGTLAPLYVLDESLGAIINNTNEKLHLLFNLDLIKNDFEKYQLNLDTFKKLLKELIELFATQFSSDQINIDRLMILCDDLNKKISTVIESYIRLARLSNIKVSFENIETQDFFKCIYDIILSFPNLNYKYHNTKSAFWICHKYKNLFSHGIKHTILVVPLNGHVASYDEIINIWVEEVLKHANTCNTLIFISSSSELDSKILNRHRQNQNIIISTFKLKDIIDILSLDNSVQILLEKTINQQIE